MIGQAPDGVAPEIAVVVIAFLLMALDLTLPRTGRRWLGYVGALLLTIPLAMALGVIGMGGGGSAPALELSLGEAAVPIVLLLQMVGIVSPPGPLDTVMVLDEVVVPAKAVFLLIAALALLLSVRFLKRLPLAAAEYYILVLLSASGLMFLVGPTELLSISLLR